MKSAFHSVMHLGRTRFSQLQLPDGAIRGAALYNGYLVCSAESAVIIYTMFARTTRHEFLMLTEETGVTEISLFYQVKLVHAWKHCPRTIA